MSSQSLLVQGAGSWGTAWAMVLSRNCYQIYLWDTNLDTIKAIRSNRCNERYLPGQKIPENIIPIESIEEAPDGEPPPHFPQPLHSRTPVDG